VYLVVPRVVKRVLAIGILQVSLQQSKHRRWQAPAT
jgi:hypothetical protein